jgi:glycosyltransferase involved in cell wall biosynthesis
MRIGFDAIRAFRNRTGLGNYARQLIRTLAQCAPGHDYRLYSPSADLDGPGGSLPSLPGVSVHTPTGWRTRTPGRQWWRTWALGRTAAADAVDLYHGLSFELPRDLPASTPSVVTVPDLIYRRHPEWFGPIERRLYHWKYGASFRAADRFVAISSQSKDDLVRYYGVQEDRITVVYPACDPAFRARLSQDDIDARLRPLGLDEGYVLTVGTIEERKNVLTLLEAWTRLPGSRRPKLVLVGRRTPYADQVDAFVTSHGLEAEVIMLHGAATSDLPALYQGARALVYPSHFEGFGLPILEAVVSGTPVIASTGSCFDEVGGPGSLYVPPTDPAALADALDRVLADDSLCTAMRDAGWAHASRFDDERLAQSLWAVYRSALA